MLRWNPVAVPSETNDAIELKVYVENSGSMDAYMCGGSDLKDAVFDYVSDLKRLSGSCSTYYINSQVIPYKGDLESYIKSLTPQSFAKAGGDRSNTDLRQMFDTIVKANGSKTVSVFVSDCILDIPENAVDFLGNCKVSIKNTFNDALRANKDLGVEIIQLESKFNGYWYCGKNQQKLNIKRPYYIWVIGDKKYLAKFNKHVPISDIQGGCKKYCAYSTPQAVPFDFADSIYTVNHKKEIIVKMQVDLSGSLQNDQLCKSVSNYKTANPQKVHISSVEAITDAANPYSHIVELVIKNPKQLPSEQITFSYPELAAWVMESNDLTGKVAAAKKGKTTGLEALVGGVAAAYKNSTTFGSVTFELKNK